MTFVVDCALLVPEGGKEWARADGSPQNVMSGRIRAASRPLLMPAMFGFLLVAALLALPAVLCGADGAHRRPKVLVAVHTSGSNDNPELSALIADSMKAELGSRSIDALTSTELIVNDAALAALGHQSGADGWGLHAQGMDLYYSREFEKAESCFERARKCLPGDEISAEFAKRCRKYVENPPEPGWEGVEVITEK
jgi:hypothetical protein